MRNALNVSLGLIVRREMSQEYLQHQHWLAACSASPFELQTPDQSTAEMSGVWESGIISDLQKSLNRAVRILVWVPPPSTRPFFCIITIQFYRLPI